MSSSSNEFVQLLEIAGMIRDIGKDIDSALFCLQTSGEALTSLITKRLYGLGVGSPNADQMHSLGWRAIAPALQRTAWAREFPPPPAERKSFEQITSAWATMVERAWVPKRSRLCLRRESTLRGTLNGGAGKQSCEATSPAASEASPQGIAQAAAMRREGIQRRRTP
jgi:hypothetical protein